MRTRHEMKEVSKYEKKEIKPMVEQQVKKRTR